MCSSAGCTQYLFPHKDSYKKDYFVPDFGMDHDILDAQNNEFDAKKFLAKRKFKEFDEESSSKVDDKKLDKEAEEAIKEIATPKELKPKAAAQKAKAKVEEPPAATATL